ncbi:hypothetical protein [Streptomyces sp. NBC_00986]|nr:hypothetical protein OG504_23480 [Streptomyces sp. NBC_00986]
MRSSPVMAATGIICAAPNLTREEIHGIAERPGAPPTLLRRVS